ncbi:MAG TPA: ATP-grasp domain-containing protein [Syntrophomonadaceae bacterium]|nr:ATP-grasp domain-containing protein [Syntrophomonadaceae bacterium]
MRLLILGAGRNQIGLINKAHEMGHEVITCDYLPDAPGRRLADKALLVSTLDRDGVMDAARRYRVDGIATVGTDQPVAVAAWAAEKLGLPSAVSYETARACTNKVLMKKVYNQAGIPCPRSFEIIREGIGPDLIKKINSIGGFPVVVKPQDSQGQRGVYLIDNLTSREYALLEDSFNFTSQNSILVEEYIDGNEITVSAWVHNEVPELLMVTDRPLLDVKPHLGLPTAHVYPSQKMEARMTELSDFVKKVIKAFEIHNGPVYLQIIIDREGRLIMNEVACRVGGGHEDRLIPLVSGFDILKAVVNQALGIQERELFEQNLKQNPNLFAAVKFMFASPGQVKTVRGLEKARLLPGVKEAVLYNPQLKEVLLLTDSTRRIGYLLVTASNQMELAYRVKIAYDCIEVISTEEKNMIMFSDLPV